MHGEIISFEVEQDGTHVIMTVSSPGEGGYVTVRVSKTDLAAMGNAQPFYSSGPLQTPTREPGR